MNKIIALILGVIAACSLSACKGQINRPHSITVEGCIAEDHGSYFLTADNGSHYHLTGNLDLVRNDIGHETVVRGDIIQSKRQPQAPPENTNGSENQIGIGSVQNVANACKPH